MIRMTLNMATSLTNTVSASSLKGLRNRRHLSIIKLQVATGHLMGIILMFRHAGLLLIRDLESSRRNLKSLLQTLRELSQCLTSDFVAMSQSLFSKILQRGTIRIRFRYLSDMVSSLLERLTLCLQENFKKKHLRPTNSNHLEFNKKEQIKTRQLGSLIAFSNNLQLSHHKNSPDGM